MVIPSQRTTRMRLERIRTAVGRPEGRSARTRFATQDRGKTGPFRQDCACNLAARIDQCFPSGQKRTRRNKRSSRCSVQVNKANAFKLRRAFGGGRCPSACASCWRGEVGRRRSSRATVTCGLGGRRSGRACAASYNWGRWSAMSRWISPPESAISSATADGDCELPSRAHARACKSMVVGMVLAWTRAQSKACCAACSPQAPKNASVTCRSSPVMGRDPGGSGSAARMRVTASAGVQ